MTITIDIYEDKRKFPRMRVLGVPVRRKGESPSLRLTNYANQRYADFCNLCKVLDTLTDMAESGKLNRSPYNFQGLFRLAILNDGDLEKGEFEVLGEKVE